MIEKKGVFDYLNILFMVILSITFIFPLLHIFSISFSQSSYIVQNRVTFFPRGFNLAAYRLIFESDRVPRAYLNTVIYTVVGTTINLVLTAASAYPLAKKEFFGRKFFTTMIIITMFFSGGLIPSFILVRSLKMIDTIWAVVIPGAIHTMELLVMRSFYQSISSELYEAAVIDGASEYRILIQIFIPLSKAAIASVGLFYFLSHWNSYFTPLIYLNDIKKLPLQVVLKDMLILNTSYDINLVEYSKMTPESMKNATIFTSMVPILLIYPFAQKYFVKGIMLGSVKG